MTLDFTDVVVAVVGAVIGAGVTIAAKFVGTYEERKARRMDTRAISIIRDMLNHKRFVERSFRAIRSRVPGYTDNELRRLLLEMGAIRIMKSRLAGRFEERYVLKERWNERNQLIAAGKKLERDE
ncbi:hypothetical protein [Reinekea sp. G2M2-21]|uniref:hypothetical protein n=1 Tax=Reinekea sp. G2M2-21 TaxID=2788942 RepID=UPI0018A8B107|nr:hypothetical protein [Reinekea sp. G2M2-21]